MDIEVHGSDPRQVIKHIRDWLSVNKPADVADPPGGVAIAADYETYLGLVPEIIADLRLDPHDELPHGDFMRLVELALPLIDSTRGNAMRDT